MNINIGAIGSETNRKHSDAALAEAALVFAALASPIRIAVLSRVAAREWSVNELVADLNMNQSALSQHLRKLRDAKLVFTRRERQSLYYRCDDPLILRLLDEVGML